MTDLMVSLVIGGSAGLLLGAVHFYSLGRVVDMLVQGPIGLGLLLQLLRFAVLGAGLYGIAQLGAVPLVCAGGGVILARSLVLRQTKGRA